MSIGMDGIGAPDLDPATGQLLQQQAAQQLVAAAAAPSVQPGSALSVSQGGTGATTATLARTNLGVAQSGNNGDITGFSNLTGNVILNAAAAALKVKEGTNAMMGAATLVAGTVTVNNTRVTANSRIFLSAQDNNTTGALRVSARVAGTSFTITSSVGADTGVIGWMILEPA